MLRPICWTKSLAAALGVTKIMTIFVMTLVKHLAALFKSHLDAQQIGTGI
jgi:hypothetical protein